MERTRGPRWARRRTRWTRGRTRWTRVDAVEAEDNEGEAGGAGWREDEEEEEAAADHLQLTMKGSRIFNRGGELICRPGYNHLKQTKEMPCSN
uniref:Uncharacterized protein n=1 Tax=Knipowitschia caucasica TaxID=637954 RepID=A0AAV2K2T4_KNICA